MTRDKPLGIGIVGLGRVAPAHIEGYRSLPDEARIVAVCDPRESARQPVGRALGVAAFAHHSELLALREIDAVVLLLPHVLHYPVALDVLKAGKHVTIEKPMALSFEECDELMAVAEAGERVLSVSENTRFVASYMELDRMVAAGRIGRIRLIRAFIYGSALEELSCPSEIWKRESTGFAAILDAAPHFFYLFKWIFGEVASVQAVTRHWSRHHGIPDCAAEDGAVVTGTLVGGGHFSVELALNVEVPWGERLEIYGERGSVVCDQLATYPLVWYDSAQDYGVAVESVAANPRGWREASIRRGAADFVRSIREGREPGVRASDAAYAVRLAEAAYHSVAQGGVRVEISP